MKNYSILKTISKSLVASACLTTAVIGIPTMIAFFICFVKETGFSFPFEIVNIVTEKDEDSNYTSVFFGSNLLLITSILFLIIAVLLFAIFYFIDKRKRKSFQ
ncbi:MAG: hypothetical protein LBM93_08475 [Oscillospiraceae bacterium]|jgi:hypothetical protein|nr:hypothetical protein [Oscillospiraceae bacterium]